MRIRLLTALLAWSLLGLTVPAFAQDDDEETSDDMDALMQSDPERAKKPAADEESAGSDDEEAPPSGDQFGDDERPPGDEPAAEEEQPEVAPPEPETGLINKFSVGLLVGYGISFENKNPWGFGFGVRAGYNFGGFYLGPRLAFQLGEETDEMRANAFGIVTRYKDSTSLWELGVEAGYDILAGSIDIKPFLGLGLAVVDIGSSSAARGYVAPGLDLLYNVSDSFFLGLDVRLQIIFSNSTAPEIKGLPLFATAGMRF